MTYGKIKIDVVKLIMGSLEDEPTITAESLQPLTYNENMDYLDCDEFICHKCGIHIEDWKRIKIDPDDGEKETCEYTFARSVARNTRKSLADSSRKSNRRRASLLHYILYIVVRR